MSKTRARAVINGQVQGVFFRSSTCEGAESVGVTGWIRNRSDGRVEAVFEGESQDGEQMIQWCSEGPSTARVTNVEVNREEYRGEFSSFSSK